MCRYAVEGLNDAGHRVGAVERALRAANKLQAIGSAEGHDAEVKGSSGIVDGNSVDDDFVVAGIAATNEERGLAAALSDGIDHGAGQKANGFGGGDRLHGCELIIFQGGGAGAGIFGGNGRASGGYDDGFGNARESKPDGECGVLRERQVGG